MIWRPTQPSWRAVVVAMSGGVDSAVTALLMRQKYDNVRAIFMENWRDETGSCTTSSQDWKDAQATAHALSIPIQKVSFEAEYWCQVFEPFVQDLEIHNRMGNPDVLCNRYIKFAALHQYVQTTYSPDDPTFLATGHYARLEHNTLRAARDKTKDQTYFLAGCTARQLRHVLFPLGVYHKHQVRQLAHQAGLPVAHKRESMGICFIGKQKSFRDFVGDFVRKPQSRLVFVDVETNEIVAETPQPEHAFLYTIGQGAKLGGLTVKYYVVETKANQVVVCRGTDHASLYRSQLRIDQFQWWNDQDPSLVYRRSLVCRIRHLAELVPCTLHVQGSRVSVTFARPVRAMTTGQWGVVYDETTEECLGGGPIASVGPSQWGLATTTSETGLDTE